MLELIRNLREDSDMSQREVAEKLGVSQQQYSQYETGVNELPLRYFAKLVEIFDVSADYLLARTERPPDNAFPNIYITRGCPCARLFDDILALDRAGRQAVVEYVELQRIKQKFNGQ